MTTSDSPLVRTKVIARQIAKYLVRNANEINAADDLRGIEIELVFRPGDLDPVLTMFRITRGESRRREVDDGADD